ncbi:MAG: decaprenyl-phosphate phosphoribosyltransferase [Phycisphaerales bacterium]
MNAAGPGPGLVRPLIRLMRLPQWSKSLFVAVGPFYAMTQPGPMGTGGTPLGEIVFRTVLTALGFSLVSSGLYCFNDVADAKADRAHPRKCRRPVASGEVSPRAASVFGVVLIAVGFACAMALPAPSRWWVLALLGMHLSNVSLYTAMLKHRRIVDVMSLALGFVLRVVAGCAAMAIVPSTWLLNATFFLSMFLAFGKRLGERRSMGEQATQARAVLHRYSLELLRMLVVVTAVATLLTYAQYVQDRGSAFELTVFDGEQTAGFGLNLLWLTMIPATFALLRAMVMVETGEYDDPTELAMKDPPFMLAAGGFVFLTVLITLWMAPGVSS